MRIAVPTEIKNNEFRVAITPAGVHDLVSHGHEVMVQAGAGVGSSIRDEQYRSAGATILPDAASVWAAADLLLKVKEPVASEYGYFRADLVLFTYLHLAAEPDLTRALLASQVTAIAYETVQLPSRALPLLAPMSEVAGRLAPIVGANAMLKPNGGPGLLVPGVPGTHPAKIAVLGGGVAGTAAMQVSLGLGAEVTVLDTNLFRLREIDALHFGRVKTIASNSFEIDKAVMEADMVIGSVLIPGAKAPKLVSNELVSRMKSGSVLVDIAVDQGGCFADSHPTTHADPTFTVHRSLFYCVANMPGAVPHTSTYALTNATLPYVRALATLGWLNALRADAALAQGLNVFGGRLISAPVALAHGMTHRPLAEVLL
ncbi:alanine dehydrogenase [Cryobacterium sp. TMS1-20-1]|uniref:Alanine dehydrogenase n=1 Tax=Cryobacterium levicorallinum TaxID=995038 RepID=A0A1I3B847_9MICO|nr:MULTISPECIES: alanine dehydrogenase [Cryobacterium]TFB83392.1 alanine dehydrogenase [Cryobacterium levicorallinum]TFC76620.1 alanine dehydrogenase [Cryobacterium sp. TMS1-20-1]TFD64699.1 alanine dehydrogenase [Cryobacterium sp. Hh38]SFH58495.1 alanine dehydrogenase [Cryobacterium levicorallinum]GEP26907.1 alanine dehydrogenase [Cryobacterium levicorallinum]